MGRRVGVARDYADTPAVPPVNFQGAAMWFAERGLRVFPLQPNLASFALGDWERNATTHPGWIRAWWAYGKPQQNCNIAIVGVGARWGIEADDPYIARVQRGPDTLYWVPKPGSWVVAPPSIVDGDKTVMLEWRGL